ncbi:MULTISPECIES: MFS transporter [Pseudonocardia]|uniref:Multidrug resistance protein stp n=1 Tax=Pseudonocardia autotrophica TaxID=2074 RepID=A0A1Y2N1M7_PSEAH|nr:MULTISPECIES: MFS transporter [Pseudonocardia]OSY40788.1 Multidrug resistance protein stp [Pseudonocardia autotrophica]TDN71905.1 MFS transporter [Pseudonocardia autotrophica]
MTGGRRTPSAGATAFNRRFSLTLVTAAVLNPVNSSIVATALVPIGESLGTPVGRVAVLVTGLYIASAVAQPAMGRFAQWFGPRRVFLAGAVVVAVGGAVGALAQDLTTLTVARVLIGIGTSAGFPSGMLMIRRRADESGEHPGRVLGTLVATSQVTVLLGLPLGGLLVSAAGWRATFWINIPLAVALLVMAYFWLPSDDRPARRGGVRRLAGELDLLGIALFGTGLTLLVGFLVSLPQAHWVLLCAALVAGGLLVGWELRAATPLVDLRDLLANRALLTTYLRTAGGMLMAYTVMYGLTQWLQGSRGLSATVAGLLIVPMSAAGALVSGPVARRGLVKVPLVVSAVLGVGMAVALLLLSGSTPIVVVVAVTTVVGVAVGLATVGNQAAVFAQADREDTGVAAGLMRTSGYVGAIASGSIIAVAFREGSSDTGLHIIAEVLIPVMVVVLLLTVFERHLPRRLPVSGRAAAEPPGSLGPAGPTGREPGGRSVH